MAGQVKILLLEDDDTFRGLLAETLELAGYAVTAVGAGAAAVDAAREEHYDIIVADVRMEGMDGLSAVEGVQSHRPGIGSLVITGYSTEEDSIRAIRLGVGDYLKKPFQIKTFLGAVEKQAEKCRQAAQAQERERTLLKTAAWGIESMARSVATKFGHPGVMEIGRLVEEAAQHLGLGQMVAEQLRLATLMVAIERAGLSTPPFILDGLPANIHHWVKAMGEEIQAEGTELELIQAGLALSEFPRPARPSQVLKGDPSVLRALDQALKSDGEEGRHGSPVAAAAGLLSLARTLEQAGDLAGARTGFQELAKSDSARLGVESQLGLARIDMAERRFESAGERALKAAAQAGSLGPSSECEIALEASLLLAAGRRPEATELAERALKLATSLGSPSILARAQLTRARVGSEPDQNRVREAALVLAQPELLDQLRVFIPWLLPLLLEQDQGEPLQTLLREFPQEVHSLVTGGTLSVEARARAAETLSPWAGVWHEKALEHLALDDDEGVREKAKASQQRGGAATPPYLRIYSLGPFQVYRGDERVEKHQWKSSKVRHVLAFLAAHGGKPVAEEILLEAFWPDDLDRARRNLSATLSHLRKNLRPEGWKEELNYLVRTRAGLQLNPDLPHWHDLHELEKASAQAQTHEREGQAEAAARAYRRMAELYQGPYLDGYYADWALARRQRVDRWVLHGLHFLARHALSTEQPLEALKMAERALELDNCSQEAFAILVEANVELNYPQEAIRQFERARTVLSRELGTEPSIELLRAHQMALLKV